MSDLHPDLPTTPQRSFCIPLDSASLDDLATLGRVGRTVTSITAGPPRAPGQCRPELMVCLVQDPGDTEHAWELLKRRWVPTPPWVDMDRDVAILMRHGAGRVFQRRASAADKKET
jgi:hypothetical protein